jgi:tRNA uridine 5-carboxymethylaminomethyl modification enzyme
MAGINASMRVAGMDPVILRRDQAYIGVLIDDLVTKGVGGEPYRMFTSRAEYRLLLREDNADLRLGPVARAAGLVDASEAQRATRKEHAVAAEIRRLESTAVTPCDEVNSVLLGAETAPIAAATTLASLLQRPNLTYELVDRLDFAGAQLPDDVRRCVQIEIKYAGYIRRQKETVERFRRMDDTVIPVDLDYAKVGGLACEAREKFALLRPSSLGQASRIPGVTPAALTLLAVHLKRSRPSSA